MVESAAWAFCVPQSSWCALRSGRCGVKEPPDPRPGALFEANLFLYFWRYFTPTAFVPARGRSSHTVHSCQCGEPNDTGTMADCAGEDRREMPATPLAVIPRHQMEASGRSSQLMLADIHYSG